MINAIYGLKTDKCEGVARLIGVGGGGVRRWPDPEERCTRTPDSGPGHIPPRGKAKGAGGVEPKSMEALIKYVIG